LAEMDRSPKALPSAQSLRGQLMRSDSARFLDRMFCSDKDFAPCDRPWAIQSTARVFGWNDGCDTPREDCGKRGLLFGRSAEAIDKDFAAGERPGAIQSTARVFGWNDGCDTPREDCGKRGLLFGRSAEAMAKD